MINENGACIVFLYILIIIKWSINYMNNIMNIGVM